MYEKHPSFIQPPDEDIKVWRYMDFTKLMSLIDSRRLFFTRADKFSDPFEGSYPKMNVLARTALPDEVTKDMDDAKKQALIDSIKRMSEINRLWPRRHAINCWHMNEHESAAMWSLYLKSNEGVAIQSTYAKLKKSLIDETQIFLGTVKYIDYDKETIQGGNVLTPFTHKRKSFEHEREVRAVVAKWLNDDKLDFAKDTINDGIRIKVDLELLVEKIYVAPNAQPWFLDLVSAAVNRYGYKFEVAQSSMNSNPLF